MQGCGKGRREEAGSVPLRISVYCSCFMQKTLLNNTGQYKLSHNVTDNSHILWLVYRYKQSVILAIQSLCLGFLSYLCVEVCYSLKF